jgi:DHA1 family tetracycline resistance protein-like MFS transporter
MNLKRIYPILLIIFINILGSGVIIPILPLYAEGQFQGTVLQITLLSTAYFGAQFIAAPWLGRLSDRYGRRPLLIISQAGTVVAFLIFIFAAPLGRGIDNLGLNLSITGGMLMLYAARILDGITGGNITIAQAYMSDVTTREQRAQGLGLLQAAFGVGFIFGPAFGGVLSNLGPVAPFIGAAIITFFTLTLTVFTLKESLPPEDRTTISGKVDSGPATRALLAEYPTLTLILMIGFIGSLGFSALQSTFALFADQVVFSDADPSKVQLYIGLMLTLNGMIQVFTQLALLRRLVKRLGERKTLLIGQVSLMVAMFGLGMINRPIGLALLLVPFAFGMGVSEPNLQALTTRFGTDRTRGRLLGLYQSARSMALIGGPVWAGFAFDAISPQAVFLVAGGLFVLNLGFAMRLLGRDIPGEGGRLKTQE